MERRGEKWWTVGPTGEWLVWDATKGIWEASSLPPPPAETPVAAKSPLRIGPRRTWLVTLLSLALASDVAGAVSRLVGISVFERIADIEGASAQVVATLGPDVIADAYAVDARDGAIAWVQVGTYLATAAAFIVWLFAVYRNLGHLGIRKYRFKPGWAIGSWFVPFLNLVRPKQIVDDAWRGSSDPGVGEIHDADWNNRRVSPLLHWWWAAFLISGFVTNFYVQSSWRARTLPEIMDAYKLGLWADVLASTVGILAIVVVLKLSRRQAARAKMLGVDV